MLDYVNDYMIEPFNFCQYEVKKTLDPINDNKVSEVAFRIFMLVAYPILGISYLIGRVILFLGSDNKSSSLRPGKVLKEQIQVLKAEGKEGWRERAMKLTRRSRQDQVHHEMERLRDVGVLNLETERRFDFSLNNVKRDKVFYLGHEAQSKIKVLFAQATEIKSLYQDTHDVFIHAQASPWLIISDMIKELYRINNPNADLRQFKFLRSSHSTAEPGSVEKLVRTISKFNPFAKKGAESYKNRWWQSYTLTDDDPKVREELLSVDAFFYNFTRFESAMYFLSNNSNILSDPKIIETIAQKMIAPLYPNLHRQKISGYVNQITQLVSSKNFSCGNLFVFCIPKKSSPKVFYRAHPFAHACKCHPKTEDDNILNKLQSGIFDHQTKCKDDTLASTVPQYRLYLPDIQPGKEQKVFLLSPIAKTTRKEIKNNIRNIVKKIHQENVA